MALELLKIDCFIYANCFNICLYMPTVLYMHTKSSCKLINHISSIAHLNCQQIGFISYHIVNMVLLMLVFYHIVLINGFISWNTLVVLLLLYYCPTTTAVLLLLYTTLVLAAALPSSLYSQKLLLVLAGCQLLYLLLATLLLLLAGYLSYQILICRGLPTMWQQSTIFQLFFLSSMFGKQQLLVFTPFPLYVC